MENFPKKYNNKLLTKRINTQNQGIEIFSSNIPLNQKMNPGCVFGMYFKDMYCKLLNLMGKDVQNITGYTISSLYYTQLNTNNTNKEKTQLTKNIKKNLSFIENLGLDNDNSYQDFVMTENFNRYIRRVFSDFFVGDKLKYDQNNIFWSKNSQREISHIDILEKEVQKPQFTIKYFIEAKGQAINVVTTRIETIFADVAIAVNPADKRYKKLIGQNVIIPIINKSIPIIGDESVDVFSGGGAVRITPGHDEFGLEIAKKHGLPTDIFAIDINGKFTEHAGTFAGKDVSEFLDNIIKYVDDIGNMESKIMIKETRMFDKNTGEELFPMALKQWSLFYDYSKDFLINYIQENNIGNIEIGQLENKTKINISSKSCKGLLIPVVSNDRGDVFCVDDDSILKVYNIKKTKKGIIMTLIILNLVLNNDLPEVFTLQELINSLYGKSYIGDTTKIQEYINIYTNLSKQDSSYKNGLKLLTGFIESLEKNAEKIEYLMEILQDSFAIQVENGKISINYRELFGVDGLELDRFNSFNKMFTDLCRVLNKLGCSYSTDPYVNIKPEDRIFLSSISESDYFVNILLLGLQYSKRYLFSDLMQYPQLVNDKGQVISNYNSKFLSKDLYENLNIYGPEVLRFTVLFGDGLQDDENSIVFDTYKANEYNLLLNKIWNANRYIFQRYKMHYGLESIKIREVLGILDDEEITDYDNWLLHNLKIVLDDFYYQVAEGKYLFLGKKIINNYESCFCDKYINITKIVRGKHTDKIMLLVGLVFLELLYPYIPHFVSAIKTKFNVDWQGVTINDIQNIQLKEKNYKINIFMELVDKVVSIKDKLGIKKHEFADIAIQANPDLLNFLKENESIFRLLTKIHDINLFRDHEEIPNGYMVDNVINIVIGVKKSVKIEGKKDALVDLQTEYNEKIEHLQHLKSLFASVYGDGENELVNKKRQEISDLQADIEDLEFKIGKLKMDKI